MFSLFNRVNKDVAPVSAKTDSLQSDVAVLVEERAVEVETISPPPLKSYKWVPFSGKAEHRSSEYLQEYAQLAELTGVRAPDLNIERMKEVLYKLDFPVYDLGEVIKYMDEKSAKEQDTTKAGWMWRPLRDCDQIKNAWFGREAERNWQSRDQELKKGASDFYRGPVQEMHNNGSGIPGLERVPTGNWFNQVEPYRLTIPLHALRRMAAVEKAYNDKENAKFFVCDYAPMPAKRPDPFLMVVVPNNNVHLGEGRFVIDFWDEPGFGIDQMLK